MPAERDALGRFIASELPTEPQVVATDFTLSGFGLTPAQYEARVAEGHFQEYEEGTVLSVEEAEARLYSGRSFSTVLCKIWRFFVHVVEAVVDGIAGVLKSLGKAVISVLSDLWDSVTDLFDGLFDSPLFWIAAGVGAWWLLGRKKKEDDGSEVNVNFLGGENG
jgi:hypothetical protein